MTPQRKGDQDSDVSRFSNQIITEVSTRRPGANTSLKCSELLNLRMGKSDVLSDVLRRDD